MPKDDDLQSKILFDRVGFAYTNASPILENINFYVKKNECVCLLGPSGSGKSTIIKLSSGLISASKGNISFNGNDEIKVGDIRGVMFHENTLLPWMTVLENVNFYAKNEEDFQKAITLLEEVGLKADLDALPHELSMGMQKRVEFVRALICDNEFLLLDEPFSALDKRNRREMWQIFNRFRSGSKYSCLIVTHDIEEAANLADRVVILQELVNCLKCTTVGHIIDLANLDVVEAIQKITDIQSLENRN